MNIELEEFWGCQFWVQVNFLDFTTSATLLSGKWEGNF